jgi:hypothetical protein
MPHARVVTTHTHAWHVFKHAHPDAEHILTSRTEISAGTATNKRNLWTPHALRMGTHGSNCQPSDFTESTKSAETNMLQMQS